MTDVVEQPLTEDAAAQAALQQQGAIPKHIAIIMDGNGRWAKKRGKMRVFGHYEGVESVRDITEACAQLGVEYLTLYTFSTENWNRPSSEVEALMTLLIHTVKRERNTLLKNNIRLRAIGDIDQLPAACRKEFADCIAETEENSRMTLNLALSYSGRWDLVKATKAIAQRVKNGELSEEDIDETVIGNHLSTAGYPDPDLLIRTGGELRVSNFLLWEIAYSELFITDEFWPEFRRNSLYGAIREYQQRDRRFGRIKP
ncbi:MAG: isoprenyl transferase [Bacteroidota bacterium]